MKKLRRFTLKHLNDSIKHLDERIAHLENNPDSCGIWKILLPGYRKERDLCLVARAEIIGKKNAGT